MMYKVTDVNGNVVMVDNRAEAWTIAETMDGNVEIEIIFNNK